MNKVTLTRFEAGWFTMERIYLRRRAVKSKNPHARPSQADMSKVQTGYETLIRRPDRPGSGEKTNPQMKWFGVTQLTAGIR